MFQGNNSTFGQTSFQFGQPAQTTFGGPSSQPAFNFGQQGQQQQPQQNKPLFGSPWQPTTQTQTPSFFGAQQQQQQQQSAPFGQQQQTGAPFGGGGNIFGGGNTFGTNNMMPATQGTGNPPYKPYQIVDSGQNMILMAISGMPQYQGKSFEELRWEDYRKQQQSGVPFGQQGQQQQQQNPMFGQSQSTSTFSPFNAQASTPFGQQQKPAFGGLTASPFQTQSQSTFQFGQQGQQQGQQPSNFQFGQQSQSQQQSTPFQFGQSGQQQSTPFQFGQSGQQQSTPFQFGQTGQQQSTFGTQGGAFQFGQTGQQQGGSTPFTGQTQSAPSLFSMQQTPSSFQFGSQTPQQGGGNAFSFGQQQTPQGQTPNFAFGMSPQMQNPVMMSPQIMSIMPVLYPPPAFYPTPGTPAATSSTSSTGTTTGVSLFGTSQQQQTPKSAAVDSMPFGSLPTFKNLPLTPSTASEKASVPVPTTQYRQYLQRSALSSRTRTPIAPKTGRLNLLEEATPSSANFFVSRPNIKKLEIDPKEDPDEDERAELNRFDAHLPSAQTDLQKSIFVETEVPRLTKPGYWMIPTALDLSAMSSQQLARVPNFVIGRKNYGKVQFKKPVDLVSLNLDKVVTFEHGEIVLYPNGVTHQAPGEGLNQPARVTLYNMRPNDQTDAALKKYEKKLQRSLQRDSHEKPAVHIKYDKKTGEWVFEVEHFSRFGIIDDDDDDDDDDISDEDTEGIDSEDDQDSAPRDDEDDEEDNEEDDEEDGPPRVISSDEDEIEISGDAPPHFNLADDDNSDPSPQRRRGEYSDEDMLQGDEEDDDLPPTAFLQESDSDAEDFSAIPPFVQRSRPSRPAPNYQTRLPSQLGLDPAKIQVNKNRA